MMRMGMFATIPTVIAHATTDHEEMCFTARELHRVLVAKKAAVRSPKMIAATPLA
jgi:hypothetical protein